MKKATGTASKTKRKDAVHSYQGFDKQTIPEGYLKYLLYLILITVPVWLGYTYYSYALSVNGFNSFPLDDGWIHLNFAKNITEYFSFSYYKDEMVTAGSTSPLYTFIVAAGFFVTDNEMLLSYVIGVLFFALSAWIVYKICMKDFNNDLLSALICAGIFILDRNMIFISLSGMETTMFVFVLALGAYFYIRKKTYALAVILGLVIWSRPDGAAFIAAVAADLLIAVFYFKNEAVRKVYDLNTVLKMAGILLLITGAYFLMNIMMAGTLFPNTYTAKISYFSDIDKKFSYITDRVIPFFTSGSYLFFTVGFLAAVIKLFYDFFKKRSSDNSMYLLFIVFFIALYFIKLPEINRFGRYVIPLIPFFIILTVAGYRELLIYINKFIKNSFVTRLIFILLAGIIFYRCISDYDSAKILYAENCKYIYDRQVKTAMWLKENTKENDILGVHDIGAIGYYSGRKIIDVAGLVTPYLNERLLEKNYTEIMQDYMKEQGVTYISFIREWYRAVNQKPLFKTPENSPQEIMEVFRYIPDSTHVISKDANYILNDALRNLKKNDGNEIVNKMNTLLEMEPAYAEAYYLRAYGYSNLNNDKMFEEDLRNAVKYYPDFKDAQRNLGMYLMEKGRYPEAEDPLNKTLEIDPKDKEVKDSLKSIEMKKLNSN